MTGCQQALSCNHGVDLRAPASLKQLVKFAVAIALAIALASVLTYTETWAIEEAPTWGGVDAVRPVSESIGSFLDTAGPIAVVH